jgi:hypothetical protein
MSKTAWAVRGLAFSLTHVSQLLFMWAKSGNYKKYFDVLLTFDSHQPFPPFSPEAMAVPARRL